MCAEGVLVGEIFDGVKELRCQNSRLTGAEVLCMTRFDLILAGSGDACTRISAVYEVVTFLVVSFWSCLLSVEARRLCWSVGLLAAIVM